MTDARCEPPEHLRSVDGWHWVAHFSGRHLVAFWFSGAKPLWRNGDGYDRSPTEAASQWGWRYVAPVPSPEAVARLVEAGRRMSECDLGLIPEKGCTCETCEAWHALRDALAAFPEERT